MSSALPDPSGRRRCPFCVKWRDDTHFVNGNHWCISCAKRNLRGAQSLTLEQDKLKRLRTRVKSYNLTADEFERMFIRQNEACAICRRREVAAKNLVIDHDHKTGVVRGLLCSGCNSGIGFFEDQPIYLRMAALYLKRARKVSPMSPTP